MPRKPKPLTDAQRVKTQAYKTAVQHAFARTREREAEIRRLVAAEAEKDNLAAWKLAWELMEEGASPTIVADTAGISRSAVYSQATRYAEYMAEHGLVPALEEVRDPWTIEVDGEEFIVTHPDLGEHRALFEEDGSLTLWKPGGVYRPINREHPERSEGEWTDEHELLYLPLTEFTQRSLTIPQERGVTSEPSEDGLAFLDDDKPGEQEQ